MTPPAGSPLERGARGVRLVGAGILAGLVCLAWLGSPWHRRIQAAWFDTCQIVSPRRIASLPAVIVAIDEKSLRELGQWPWPRTVLAQLIAAIAGHDPAAIGVDVLMPEADRLTPARLAARLPAAESELRGRLSALPDNDAVLAAAMTNLPVVLGIAGVPEPSGTAPRAAPFRLSGREPQPRVRQFGGAVTSIEILDRAAAGHGLLSSDQEGGVIRRMPLVARVGDTLVPGLGLDMLRVAAGAPLIELSADGTVVKSVGVGDLTIPAARDGAAWLHFSPGDARRFVPAVDVLNGRVAPDRLQRKLVLIGATGLGLSDYQTVATGERLPGVEVHAQLLESVFDGTTLRRPSWARTAETLALLVLGVLLIWAVPVLPPRRAIAGGLASLLLVAGGAFALFRRSRLLFDAGTPVVSLLLLLGALMALTLVEAAKRQKRLEREVQRQREEAARVAGELEAARRLQLGMLPHADSFKAEARLDLAAAMTPAREVGGDLYDFFPLDANRMFFLIGDVAGKGLPASIFMAVSKALFKSNVLRNAAAAAPADEIGAAMSAANREVSRENSEMLFVTLFAGILDLETGELSYCNAGHDNPSVLDRSGGVRVRLEGGGGPPLCTVEHFAYRGATRRLEPGQSLCLTTDGVTEAQNASGEFYGGGRLQQVLQRLVPGGSPASALLEAIQADVALFTGTAELADDVTVLVLRWNGPAAV